MGTEEDNMTSTLTPTCSFCGLGFGNRPMLDLHIREDHRRRGDSAGSGQGDQADACLPEPRAEGPDSRSGQPAAPSSNAREAITMTGAPRYRRQAGGSAVTALRRVTGAVRGLNAELRLASEAMFRLPGAPRPHRSADPSAGQISQATAASDRADHAA
jgi:hypothetical protein